MFHRIGPVALLLCFSAVPGLAAAPGNDARKVDFNRDVRTILSDNCFKCHGPDEKQRKAKLRLDTREGLRGAVAEILSRVTSSDPQEIMPPAESGKRLSPEQIAILKAWLDQGAHWSSHWAFVAPARPAVPDVRDRGMTLHNAIDHFVVDRLQREGMRPSPPADKVTLLRRVTLDFTGLPPTPEEVDEFLKDTRSDAYERVVDRLLTSPRYGERQAWRWLEASRYSDTNGYQTDAGRDMWRWRDWVIEAFNRNLPYDQFTVEQLAGDLLSSATLDQRIATGFNRNHRGNAEGGIIPEEYAVEYVADRVETTATVWLGLTFTCCRCHDHKFDPFSQREYYQLFAFFNNVPEKGRAVKFGNSPPFIKAPTREQSKRLAEFDETITQAEKHLDSLQNEISKAQLRWESSADAARLTPWSAGSGLVKTLTLNDASAVTVRDGKATFEAGPGGSAVSLDGNAFLDAGDLGNFGFDDRFSLACWINPSKPEGMIVSRMTDEPQGDGYGVSLVAGKVQVHLTKRWLDDALRIETTEAIPLNRWSHIVVTYDATRLATGTKISIDGKEAKVRVLLDELNQTFETKQPLRIGAGGGPNQRFAGRIADVKIFKRAQSPDEVRLLAVRPGLTEILRTASQQRKPEEAQKLREYFLAVAAPQSIREAVSRLRQLREQREQFWDQIPTVMVMEEMPTPRRTHLLLRGEYDKPGEAVSASTPAALSAFAKNLPRNRLGFAKWLVDRQNPLTSRVAVNRAWQMHFGTGLVQTTEDFGTQGKFPTHPELLDWLAIEFARDWDLKRLHKLIVLSATYRQSSHVTKEQLARDPENHLLGRFPRLRLSAEAVRDQALFVSGLLVEKQGGPSVKPYQPAGLWKELSGADEYVPDHGENLYRRSLYTYWKRTAPPPMLSTFDASARETCWVRETRTNTPLQALTLLNETAFVEAARNLAQRLMQEAKTSDRRLTQAFRRVTARTPRPEELKVLRENLEFQMTEYRQQPEAIRKLLSIGESKPDPALNTVELAAYTAICNLLLNLDEAVTKE